jgi:hypothetical protein
VIAKEKFQNLRYAFEIHQLEKAIHDFVQYQIPAQLSLKLKNIISKFKSLRHMYELGAVYERRLNETIVPKLTNDAHEMAMMLQKWVQMVCLKLLMKLLLVNIMGQVSLIL